MPTTDDPRPAAERMPHHHCGKTNLHHAHEHTPAWVAARPHWCSGAGSLIPADVADTLRANLERMREQIRHGVVGPADRSEPPLYDLGGILPPGMSPVTARATDTPVLADTPAETALRIKTLTAGLRDEREARAAADARPRWCHGELEAVRRLLAAPRGASIPNAVEQLITDGHNTSTEATRAQSEALELRTALNAIRHILAVEPGEDLLSAVRITASNSEQATRYWDEANARARYWERAHRRLARKHARLTRDARRAATALAAAVHIADQEDAPTGSITLPDATRRATRAIAAKRREVSRLRWYPPALARSRENTERAATALASARATTKAAHADRTAALDAQRAAEQMLRRVADAAGMPQEFGWAGLLLHVERITSGDQAGAAILDAIRRALRTPDGADITHHATYIHGRYTTALAALDKLASAAHWTLNLDDSDLPDVATALAEHIATWRQYAIDDRWQMTRDEWINAGNGSITMADPQNETVGYNATASDFLTLRANIVRDLLA